MTGQGLSDSVQWEMIKHLIIDGYNVLGLRGQVGPQGRTDPSTARDALVRDLSAYRQRKGHPVTVVFDGWQRGPGAEHREYRAGIEVCFSRRGQRADQVIQRLAEEYGADCAVVSSDREVMDFARSRGAFVIGALEFESRLQQVGGKPPLPALHASRTILLDAPPTRPDKKGNPKKLPKAVRKRLRELKSF